ncbi:MAG TPA: nuclear transport factor 2 family protein [Acidimicrobiales bacterium]|nr:nuclear transport factor 2 family protein [Acidimicrobiales bacterium]
MLGIEDRMAIHELLALYGHVIDERRWTDLDQVFTADAIYDGTDFGMPVTRSLADLIAEWTSEEGLTRHPLAHHATNIVVTARDDGTALVRSKGIGVGNGGRVGSVTYVDEAVRTDAGWRLRSRTVTLRRPG